MNGGFGKVTVYTTKWVPNEKVSTMNFWAASLGYVRQRVRPAKLLVLRMMGDLSQTLRIQ